MGKYSFLEDEVSIETSRIMIRNHLHSQRIKTIKTITGSSMDFFLIYKCLQLARIKSSPPPPPPLPFTPFCLCATISDCFNIFPFCFAWDDFQLYWSIQIIFARSVAFLLFWHFTWLQIACKQNEGQPFFVDGLKVFRYSFSETIPMFFNRLKSNLSLPDRHKIFTSMDWLWIEVCQNAIFSKIDITMTTMKKTLKSI